MVPDAADGYVQIVSSGNYINRLSVVITGLASQTTSVDSIVWKNTNIELYDTAQDNGTFSNDGYTTTIILPNDTIVSYDDMINQVPVTVYLNKTNVFQSSTAQGSSSGNQITIPASIINTPYTTINMI